VRSSRAAAGEAAGAAAGGAPSRLPLCTPVCAGATRAVAAEEDPAVPPADMAGGADDGLRQRNGRGGRGSFRGERGRGARGGRGRGVGEH